MDSTSSNIMLSRIPCVNFARPNKMFENIGSVVQNTDSMGFDSELIK